MNTTILTGSDKTTSLQQLEDLTSQLINATDRAFNYIVLDNPDVETITDALNLVLSFPFGVGGHRLLVLKNTKLFDSKLDKSSLEFYTRVMSNLPETSSIIFLEETVKKTNKLFKNIKEYLNLIKNDLKENWTASESLRLAKAIAAKDFEQVCDMSDELERLGTPLLKTVVSLIYQMEIYYKLQLGLSIGMTDAEELADFCKVKNSRRIHFLRGECAARTTRTYGAIVLELLECETLIKTGVIKTHAQLKPIYLKLTLASK